MFGYSKPMVNGGYTLNCIKLNIRYSLSDTFVVLIQYGYYSQEESFILFCYCLLLLILCNNFAFISY